MLAVSSRADQHLPQLGLKSRKAACSWDAFGQEVNEGCWCVMSDTGHMCCIAVIGRENGALKGIDLKFIYSVSYKLLALCGWFGWKSAVSSAAESTVSFWPVPEECLTFTMKLFQMGLGDTWKISSGSCQLHQISRVFYNLQIHGSTKLRNLLTFPIFSAHIKKSN